MTIGDVLAFALLIAASGITAWAAILAAGLLFSERARRASEILVQKPGAAIGRGALVAVLGFSIGIGLMNSPAAPLKMFGIALMMGLLLVSTIGSAGLAAVLGSRIGKLAPNHSAFTVFARGAALLVAASYVPALGWFLLFPLQLFAGIGAGMAVLRRGAAMEPEAQSQGYLL